VLHRFRGFEKHARSGPAPEGTQEPELNSKTLASRRNATLAFIALALIWGSSFPFVKIGLRDAPPLLFAGIRVLLGGAGLVVVAAIWSGRPRFRGVWHTYVISGVFNSGLFVGLQTIAVQDLPSGLAAVLVYLQPIVTGLLAAFFLGESLDAAKVVGLVLGFLGVIAVSFGDLGGHFEFSGLLAGVVGGVSWSIGTVYFKQVQGTVSMLWFVAISFVLGGVGLTVVGSLTESWGSVVWSSSGFWGSLLFISLAAITLAWVLWLGLVSAGEASRASAYIFVVPLTSVAIGVIFLGEPFTIALVVGALLIVAGIYLVNRTPQKEGSG
jgi:O-acetylserine/cysteine efflux transporter